MWNPFSRGSNNTAPTTPGGAEGQPAMTTPDTAGGTIPAAPQMGAISMETPPMGSAIGTPTPTEAPKDVTSESTWNTLTTEMKQQKDSGVSPAANATIETPTMGALGGAPVAPEAAAAVNSDAPKPTDNSSSTPPTPESPSVSGLGSEGSQAIGGADSRHPEEVTGGNNDADVPASLKEAPAASDLRASSTTPETTPGVDTAATSIGGSSLTAETPNVTLGADSATQPVAETSTSGSLDSPESATPTEAPVTPTFGETEANPTPSDSVTSAPVDTAVTPEPVATAVEDTSFGTPTATPAALETPGSVSAPTVNADTATPTAEVPTESETPAESPATSSAALPEAPSLSLNTSPAGTGEAPTAPAENEETVDAAKSGSPTTGGFDVVAEAEKKDGELKVDEPQGGNVLDQAANLVNSLPEKSADSAAATETPTEGTEDSGAGAPPTPTPVAA